MLEITVACIIILEIKLSLYFPVEIDKYYQVLSNAVKPKINEASLVTKIVPFCSSLTGAHWFQSSLNQNIGIILKLNGSRFSLWKQENVSDSGNQCSSKIYSCQCISSSFCCRQCIISKTHNSSLSEEKFVRFFRFSWYWIKNCFYEGCIISCLCYLQPGVWSCYHKLQTS